jgi:hypothetical protein
LTLDLLKFLALAFDLRLVSSNLLILPLLLNFLTLELIANQRTRS